MTSGVYELKFSSGDRYIGKSIDIENRWRQHYDKFQKGTAAKAMQAAYNRYGCPTGSILLECHSDHIDIMEAVYIARHRPELNSDRPADPFPGVDIDYYINNTDYLSKSTLSHMVTMSEDWDTIKALRSSIVSLSQEIEELEELNDALLVKRSSEEINSSTGTRLKAVSKSVDILNRQLIEAKDEILKLQNQLDYYNLPWWKRLFK